MSTPPPPRPRGRTTVVAMQQALAKLPGDFDLDLAVVVRNPAAPNGQECVPVKGFDVSKIGTGLAHLAFITDLTKGPSA